MSNLNLELRSKVLEKSLFSEENINKLILSHLGILDRERTKNFGNKAGISFKNKIDLLYDLNVLNKEEHYNLELQMIFRNKFLHDLNCNSFEYIIEKLDNGIVNKFMKFGDQKKNINSEEGYIEVFENLYKSNYKIITEKFRLRKEIITQKKDLIFALTDGFSDINSIVINFGSDILEIFENSDLENPEILNLSKIVEERAKTFSNDLSKKFSSIIESGVLDTEKNDLMHHILK